MTKVEWQDEVLDFWFKELTPEDWYKQSDAVDAMITKSFAALYNELAGSIPTEAPSDPRAALAAVIALDQFPRNMFRGSARAFASDEMALRVATNAVDKGLDAKMNQKEKHILYMPFMHAETLEAQDRCVKLFKALGDEEALKYAVDHRDIVAQFGRFPHRNEAMGRESTPAELDYLKDAERYGQ
ncbi:MAG: DUF924 family protein [Parasphingorhabdus sp.]